jgi:dimeric dUTPase (all-alpha-NTP-PPase superfamily)
MLKLQGTMNALVNPDWKNANYNWRDAIMLEAAEAFNHTSWKWWKDTSKKPDWGQIKLEVIDIWHFILSIAIENDMTAEEILNSRWTEDELGDLPIMDQEALRDVLREVISDSVRSSDIELLDDIFVLTVSVGMTLEDVYNLYVPKNVLNIFRQNNGYKAGTYIKNWNSNKFDMETVIEDNQVLTSIVETTKPELLTAELLTGRLYVEYEKVKETKRGST